MTDEMKQLMKSTLLDYLNKESVIQDEVEFDVDKVQDEVFEFWENQVLTEFGLTNSTEDEKREFLKTYRDDWENSFLEEESYFEPDISLEAEELQKEILNSKSPTIDFYKLLWFIENQKFKKQIKTAKIKLNFSPTQFKKLIVKLFEKNEINIDENRKNQISFFIINCFSFNTKKYFLKISDNKTINFLDKKSLKTLYITLILLHKYNFLTYTSVSKFAEILRNDLEGNNKPNIGLSKALRDNISKYTNYSENELIKLAGFKNSVEIKSLINN